MNLVIDGKPVHTYTKEQLEDRLNTIENELELHEHYYGHDEEWNHDYIVKLNTEYNLLAQLLKLLS